MVARIIDRLVGAVFAVPVTFVLRKVLRRLWRRSRGSEPPRSPAAPDTTWKEAVAWAVASAVALAVGQVVASRGAAQLYRAMTGRTPPGLGPARSKGRRR